MPIASLAIIIVVIILLFIIFCFIGWFIAISNSINKIKLKIEESLSGVEIQLRQRYDVLMEGKKVAEQYAKHEQKVLEDLRHLNQLPSNATIAQINEAAASQELAVKGLYALGEAYPELKSAELFNNLISQLANQSEQYSASRRAVNGNITKLNNYVVTFPSSIVCGMKSVTQMDYIHEENLEQMKNIDMTMNI
ncbi:MAG: LemA family protein [Lachnospiraceae bacterium]|nr:LemA family protein [Lachnospiraceae bacterium]